MDCSPPGSSVPGILQARVLEWVAVSFSNACKWKVKVKMLSRVRLLASSWTTAYQAPLSMRFSRQEYWSGVPLPSTPIKLIIIKKKIIIWILDLLQIHCVSLGKGIFVFQDLFVLILKMLLLYHMVSGFPFKANESTLYFPLRSVYIYITVSLYCIPETNTAL